MLDGKPVGGTKPFDMVKLGIALVPEGRKLFPSLTVEENLLMGASGKTVDRGWTLDARLRPLPDPPRAPQPARADAVAAASSRWSRSAAR